MRCHVQYHKEKLTQLWVHNISDKEYMACVLCVKHNKILLNSIELINALILFLSKATRHKTQFLSLCKFNLVLFWSLCKSDSIISDLCQVESDLGPTDCCCDVYVIVTRVFMET